MTAGQPPASGEVNQRMAKSDEPITIKKYANRRLYNTGTSTYVTLEDLATMVKAGEDFVVYDAKTNEDITRSVLTQIIFEQENKEGGQNLLPINFLRQLIRFYGDSMQMMVPRYLEVSIDSLTREQEKFREQISHGVRHGRLRRRSRSRCAGTWKCSSAPFRCLRRSRGRVRAARAPPSRTRTKPAAGSPPPAATSTTQAPDRRDAEAHRPASATRTSSPYDDAQVRVVLRRSAGTASPHGRSIDARPISSPCR